LRSRSAEFEADPADAIAVRRLSHPPPNRSQLDSVVRPRPRRAPRRSLVLAIAVLALATSGGAFAATQLFGPLHGGKYRPRGGPVICQIFGLPGLAAAQLLDQQGYSVAWRSQTWGGEVLKEPEGKEAGAIGGGYSAAVAEPPATASSMT